MPKQTRRRFSPEFKSGAVEMATRPGASISHAARDLNVGEASLHEWIKQSRGVPTRGLSAPLNGPVGETERDELIRNVSTRVRHRGWKFREVFEVRGLRGSG